ncbi:MAG: diguanylate cyclase [Solirubrobacteraceae bacterium]
MKDHSEPAPTEGTAAERLARAAHAAQQLCDTLWEALHEELRDPDAERTRELSGRLAEVASTVALLAAGDFHAVAPAEEPVAAEEPAAPTVERRIPPTPSESPQADTRSAPDLRLAPHPPAVPEPSMQEDRRVTPKPSVGSERTSAFDRTSELERPSAFERSSASERSPAPEPPSSLHRSGGSGSPGTQGLPPRPDTPVALQPIPTRAGDYTFTKLVDEHAQGAAAEPEDTLAAEIEIRDVRREEGPSAWVSSVGRLLARHGQDGLPFAVLLVEIVDVARLERSETPHDLHGLVAQVESALGRGMRSSDELSRETLGRYWLVAPETNGTGARMLAERLARLVRTSAVHRGVPLEVAIGIAVCPDDGTEAPALAARADLGVYSARATGRSIAHTEPPSQR